MNKLLNINSKMQELIGKSALLVRNLRETYMRSLVKRIDWSDRLIGIVGARGTGKTTLLLQQLERLKCSPGEAVYITLDDLYFTEINLVSFAERFRAEGGRFLFIDEVHKYPMWAREIKNIYDTHRDLKIVFTGSSITDMLRQDGDLSRRSVLYELPGLSFREFLAFEKVVALPEVSLKELLKHHQELAHDWTLQFRPLKFFTEYLNLGYYPFYAENKSTYHIRIEQVVKMTIETDLRYIEGYDTANSRKIFKLLYILATNVPFKPNISSLSEKIGVHRNTLVQYINHLEKARLINTLGAVGKSVSTLQKPDKIFLENSNLQFALAPMRVNRGTLRETFFMNQLLHSRHQLSLPVKGDFLVDDEWNFEIGGRDKADLQIRGLKNGFIASDDIENGIGNRIPLWMFGFLY
ncbi:MAG: ATP-binding protein [Bacteroidetes bacterium]|nr:ATP-binding protein [Bacteroidota bacterium]